MSEVTIFGCNMLQQRLLNVSWGCGFGGLLGCLHHRRVHFTQRAKFHVHPLTETLGQGEGKSARW